jgi:hypothetical protein
MNREEAFMLVCEYTQSEKSAAAHAGRRGSDAGLRA